MSERPYHVLFLCTGNSARSILAEALLERLGDGRFRAHSAGSHPKGEVHPLALEVLHDRGHDTSGLRSKGWEELAGPGAPELDVVVTVCDAAAGETCPVWPGRPVTAHWSLEDPAAATGPEDEQRCVFEHTYRELERRIERLTRACSEALDRSALQARLDEIARSEAGAGGQGG